MRKEDHEECVRPSHNEGSKDDNIVRRSGCGHELTDKVFNISNIQSCVGEINQTLSQLVIRESHLAVVHHLWHVV